MGEVNQVDFGQTQPPCPPIPTELIRRAASFLVRLHLFP